MSENVPLSAEKDAGVVYDMIRERDHYRAACHAAVDRLEREAGKVIDASGIITARVIPTPVWREIRAMLQAEPRPLPPEGSTP